MTSKRENQRKQAIPEFASREEEAKFWDTHDMSDYWDELEPVRLKTSKNLSRGITIRFDEETLRQLRKYAHQRGIGPTTLARMWILEQLQRASHSHNS
jgi:predicted DNA binding CopG/RHH family protein